MFMEAWVCVRAGNSGFGANKMVGRDTCSETFVPRLTAFRRLSTSRDIIICANLKNGRYTQDIVGYMGVNTYMLLRSEYRECEHQCAFWGAKHPWQTHMEGIQ